MWLLRDISRAVAKDYMREKKRKTKEQEIGEVVDIVGGEKLYFVESMTQEEYDASVSPEQLKFNKEYAEKQTLTGSESTSVDEVFFALTPEQEKLIRIIRNEGERVVNNLYILASQYGSRHIDFDELTQGIHDLEHLLHDHFYVHSDPFHQLPLATLQALHNEYHQEILKIKRDCDMI